MKQKTRPTERRRCARRTRQEDGTGQQSREMSLAALQRAPAAAHRVRRGRDPARKPIPRARIPVRKLLCGRNLPAPAGFQKIWQRWYWTTRRLA